ncbi:MULTISPECIES: hypothetical protein [unclassified Marinobacter]|uniref:hypothetical protein n=1 Tax=unclassified Marinobacter TaxID=83889 RepID=UPI0026E3A217|nr:MULTISPECIES: hypothetical protein [unclassified Marinobacter]MDO6444145.1 hypothetical protein [Marinobacter sp. 2_MG-2023]MDO6825298.1 hypothetical protein [Marinobacter sp. 1_MG-2023]
MKWFALALLLLNASLWIVLSEPRDQSRYGSSESGTLPRVASLKPPEVRVPEHSELEGFEFNIAPGEPSAIYCVTFGWFESLAAAEALANGGGMARFSAYQVKERERQLAPLHWIIIPPQPGQVALDQLKDLQERGVDSYLVAQGENRNAISLGLFESREAAISVLEEKKQQNLNAVLVNFPRNQLSYALSFEVSPGLVEELVSAAKADYGNNFDFIEINACKGVATPVKNP